MGDVLFRHRRRAVGYGSVRVDRVDLMRRRTTRVLFTGQRRSENDANLEII